MENKLNIYQKLNKVQTELKANKSQYNSFGKYSYRSCEDILESLKPLLLKYEAIVSITDNVELIGDRYYIKATVLFIDAETGQKIEASAFAREDESKKGMDSSQITGSVSSYARKYALNGLFAIDDNKDSDSTNTHGKDTTTPNNNTTAPNNNTTAPNSNTSAPNYNNNTTTKTPSIPQIKRFWALLKISKMSKQQVFIWYKDKTSKTVTENDWNMEDYNAITTMITEYNTKYNLH